jgi:hypothetical protein
VRDAQDRFRFMGSRYEYVDVNASNQIERKSGTWAIAIDDAGLAPPTLLLHQACPTRAEGTVGYTVMGNKLMMYPPGKIELTYTQE